MNNENLAFLADEVLNTRVEKWSLEQVQALAFDVFGVAGEITPLTGERDQNFQLKTGDGVDYLLKVTHPAEAREVTMFQTKVQERLMAATNALPVPHIVRTKDGQPIYWHKDSTGATHAVRLMTFLPGVPLYKVDRSSAQRFALGRALAQFDMALTGFDIVQPYKTFLWDTQRADQLRGLLSFIEDETHRELARRLMDRFEHEVRPQLASLRRQVIHNDLNAYNVMVDSTCHNKVTGILDFGDIVIGPLVFDVGVAAAYQLAPTGNPLVTASEFVAGYHATNPLTDEEICLLPDLIATRLLTTVAITGWRATLHPENREYILRNNPLSWDGLLRMSTISRNETVGTIRRAIATLEEWKNVYG
ncbi:MULTISPECIES: phosphotransferase [unclassified Burkholderia]|uniref:phosphotransferase n=1 Tax=unclassified Burkholderia TaxID=2613784 RepID=UPI000F577791|nr:MULTISPECIES: phosphotransferase [unclassified Burkholderia]RQR68749.1 homoserine kinase [Burkholderia sp. Bp9012]RQR70068.1 homoserine kinase [Burkholderia sp. Bp9011]RQR82982.1 homoserine kinase [Burkholderia sp. Bp9010]RQZ39412.1 homoserine kinase [Burkholderia sp. Bp9099]